MTSDEELRLAALAQLTSRNPHDRYRSAKVLHKLAHADDLTALMNARRVETDNTALRWLESAITACAKRAEQEAQQQGPLEPVIEPEAIQSIRAQAIEWIAGVLLHEIGAKIGLLSSAARDEIASYENSLTAKHINHLELIFEGILHLRKASAAPNASEFDLAELIESIVALEAVNHCVDVSLVGRKPLILFSDSNLVRLALCNGIRNALEAVELVADVGNHGIVINWGITDSEFWVSVIDQGVGLIPVGDTAFEIGKTTKDGHAGFGLAIARQAMEKLNGTVALARSVAGGATYEIKGKLLQ